LPLRAELDLRVAAPVRRRLRDRGVLIRWGMDALIATIAINHQATVLHQDADFERIATVSELHQERWTA
jgi:predicted nucleic acid-binding protein